MTISDMTNTDAKRAAVPAYFPLADWESASRYQAATFDWMARAFQQWLTLMTTMPAQFMMPLVEPHGEASPPTPAGAGLPTTADTQRVARAASPPTTRTRSTGTVERAVAKDEPRRAARPAAKARSKGRAATKRSRA